VGYRWVGENPQYEPAIRSPHPSVGCRSFADAGQLTAGYKALARTPVSIRTDAEQFDRLRNAVWHLGRGLTITSVIEDEIRKAVHQLEQQNSGNPFPPRTTKLPNHRHADDDMTAIPNLFKSPCNAPQEAADHLASPLRGR